MMMSHIKRMQFKMTLLQSPGEQPHELKDGQKKKSLDFAPTPVNFGKLAEKVFTSPTTTAKSLLS